MIIELASANPKREWSVKMALMPMVRAWNIASWARVEKACNKTFNISFNVDTGLGEIHIVNIVQDTFLNPLCSPVELLVAS